MRVEFEFTPEEMVDVHRRALKRSQAVRSFQRTEWVSLSLISGGLGFLLWLDKGWRIGLFVGALSGLIAAILYPTINKRLMDSRLRKLLREKRDPREPLVCEVELTAAGVWIRQAKTQTILEWESVAAITLTDDGVEIISKSGGLMVRNRAFKSDDDRKQFLILANSYHAPAVISNKQ
jgi:hypothetical protein